MADLPPTSSVLSSQADSDAPLARAISTLFEPSPILFSTLVPQLVLRLSSDSPHAITSYSELISAAIDILSSWDDGEKVEFIAAHPRIGENRNLSNLSAKEQGGITAPEVLAKLETLNALYEKRYVGLRYITFVNGRSRAAIAEEMEGRLGVKDSLLLASDIVPEEVGGVVWRAELDRAIVDVGQIAYSRLQALGVR